MRGVASCRPQPPCSASVWTQPNARRTPMGGKTEHTHIGLNNSTRRRRAFNPRNDGGRRTLFTISTISPEWADTGAGRHDCGLAPWGVLFSFSLSRETTDCPTLKKKTKSIRLVRRRRPCCESAFCGQNDNMRKRILRRWAKMRKCVL